MTSDDDFQRRSSEEGRKAQEIAGKVLRGCGFKNLDANHRFKPLGLTVNFIGEDAAGREWYFDVSGAFTSDRAGLIRTDTMWKSLGRANVLHQSGVRRLVLLTTNLPKPESGGHLAMTAAAATFFDAVEMLSVEGKARLSLYAAGGLDRPLPGLRAAKSVYPGLTRKVVGKELQVRVPMIEVAAALPARAVLDVVVMPNRVKIFLPSRDSAGALLTATKRKAAGQRIRKLLADFAGGCTLTPGLGAWIDPIGGEMFEDVTLIEAFAPAAFPDAIIAEVVNVLLADLRQHTAALIINDAMVNITPR